MPSGASAWCAVTDGSAVAARTQLLSLLAGCTSSVEAVLRLVPRTTMDSRCVASRTRIAWDVTRDARRFLRVQVSLLCSGCSRDDVMHTRWAFDDCIKEFGPENFSTLQRCVKDEIRAPSMQVSAVLGHLKVQSTRLANTAFRVTVCTDCPGAASPGSLRRGCVLQVQAGAAGQSHVQLAVRECSVRHDPGHQWGAWWVLNAASLMPIHFWPPHQRRWNTVQSRAGERHLLFAGSPQGCVFRAWPPADEHEGEWGVLQARRRDIGSRYVCAVVAMCPFDRSTTARRASSSRAPMRSAASTT